MEYRLADCNDQMNVSGGPQNVSAEPFIGSEHRLNGASHSVLHIRQDEKRRGKGDEQTIRPKP